jgi:O-antigen ligase
MISIRRFDAPSAVAGAAIGGLGIAFGAALVALPPRFSIGLVAIPLIAMALVKEPALVLLPFGLFEEYYRDAPVLLEAPRASTFGHQFYESTVSGLPLPLLVLVAAYFVAAFRSRPADTSPLRSRRARTFIVIVLALAVFVGLLAVVAAPSHGPRILGSAARAACPWLELILVFMIVRLRLRPRQARITAGIAVGSLIVFKGLIAVWVELTVGGFTVDTQHHMAFYDAASPAIAAAFLVHILVSRYTRFDVRTLVVAAAAFTVVLLSFRRSIWIMLPAGLLAGPLLTRSLRGSARVVAVVVLAIGCIWALPSSVVGIASGRIAELTDQIAGSHSPGTTATEHRGDIVEGFRLVKSHLVQGLGIDASQPPGLAVPQGRGLYVHNELVQDWLRFGLVGGMLVCALTAALLWWGFSVVREDTERPIIERVAAMGAVLLPLPLITAPFLSTTHRWPAIVGAMAALLVLRSRPHDETASALEVSGDIR